MAVAYRDIEKRRAYGREWMKRNPEKAVAAVRRWRQRHPDAWRAQTRGRYAANPEGHKAAMTKYHAAHPEIVRAKSIAYRSRKLTAEGAFSAKEWKALVAMHGGRCGYCGRAGPLQADHRVPLARGGTNFIQNIVPACGSCNRRKHTRSEAEFRALLADQSAGK